jgi:beta-mannanase
VALGITSHPLNAFVSQVGRTPAIIDNFVSWQSPSGAGIPFPAKFVDHITAMGSVPMITWQPGQGHLDNVRAGATQQQASNLTSIIDGSHDAFIRQWAQAAKADGHTVYVRLMHEMNGDWYPWGYTVYGQTPAQYVAAFQHVVNIFHQVGATNVQFVWCEATQASAKPGAAPITEFFPGDAYVSWVSMDGYNRNPNKPKTFADIFSRDYATLTQISTRPIMIAEMGTVEIPGNPDAKAQWITNAFMSEIPQNFPRIKAVLYFNSRGHGYTYPLDSDPSALDAYKQVVNDPYYQMAAPQTTQSYQPPTS